MFPAWKPRFHVRKVAALVVILCLSVAALAAFLFAGNRVFVVTTPSMGQTLLVGTLVVVHEQSLYDTGDIVSFTANGSTYTHRIVGSEGEFFRTKGDLNGAPDAWLVEPEQITGAVQWHLPGVGWLLLALPWLLLGGAVIETAVRVRRRRPAAAGSQRRRISPQGRMMTRILGWSVTLAVINLLLRPWTNAVLMGYTAADDGGVLMRVVSTGLLPVTVEGTRLVSGEDAVIYITEATSTGVYRVTPLPDLDPWQYVLIAVFCLLPVLVGLSVRVSVNERMTSAEAERLPPAKRVKRLIPLFSVGSAAVIAVSLVLNLSTLSAFSATVRNTSNAAGSAQAFTCRQAIAQIRTPAPYFGWSLGDLVKAPRAAWEPDVTAAGIYGQYVDWKGNTNIIPWKTEGTTPGCVRDTPTTAIRFRNNLCLTYFGVRGSTRPVNFAAPRAFSLSVWFRAQPGGPGGKIIGFRPANGTAGDRHLYLGANGAVYFGMRQAGGARITLRSGKQADGQWRHIVATYTNNTKVMTMYVDGVKKSTRKLLKPAAAASNGRWQVGCGKLDNWPSGKGGTMTGRNYFTGDIQYTAAYKGVLTENQAQALYESGRPR